MAEIKKILLVGHDNEGSAYLFQEVTKNFPDASFCLLLCHGLYYRKSFFQSVKKLLLEASLIFVIYRFIELTRYRLFHPSLASRCKAKNIPVIHSHDINSAETLQAVRDFSPDVLVSLYTMQIYKQEILSIPRHGAISSHPSLLPAYRGLEVFFWVLANNEKETGVSVFYLSPSIDEGALLKQERVPLHAETTVSSLYRQVTCSAGRLLTAAIKDICEDSVSCVATAGESSYYPMPDAASMKCFRKNGRRFWGTWTYPRLKEAFMHSISAAETFVRFSDTIRASSVNMARSLLSLSLSLSLSLLNSTSRESRKQSRQCSAGAALCLFSGMPVGCLQRWGA